MDHFRKRMDFCSNSVVSGSPNYMDFRLLTANTMEKIKSVIGPTTRVERLTNGSDWLTSRHGIEEFMVERVREGKLHSRYIIENEFETMEVFERECISVT